MFNSLMSFIAFLVGVALTVGLILTSHTVPGGAGHGTGYLLSDLVIALIVVGGLVVLAVTLWASARLVGKARSWKNLRLIGGTVLIAVVANTLYVLLVELFALRSGIRVLVAVFGVPVIYGNIARRLRGVSLKKAMSDIFERVLMTVGAAFIVASIIRGW